jgi:DNA-binding GntR family transcriptional regulator
MSPKIDRSDPPYAQVVRHIRDQILSGELRDGDTVPSVRKIADEWGISQATATKVHAALRSEGLVKAVTGIGTVVNASKSLKHGPKDRFQSIRQTGRIYPKNERAEIKSAMVVAASEQVSDALGVEQGSSVIRRHRVAINDDTNSPVSASISWFKGELADQAPELLATDRLRQGTPRYIEEMTGQVAAKGQDQVAASEATEQDAQDLGVATGSPVLRGRNWLYDTEGNIIEYGEYVTVPERWSSYEYTLTN